MFDFSQKSQSIDNAHAMSRFNVPTGGHFLLEIGIDKKYHFWYITIMTDLFRLKVVFYKTETGNEPVREWLQDLTRAEKKVIGEDIKVVQLGWPLGMPLIRKLENDLWEIRSHLKNRTARVLFTVIDDNMILLHGFIKKSQKIPKQDIRLARKRIQDIRSHK